MPLPPSQQQQQQQQHRKSRHRGSHHTPTPPPPWWVRWMPSWVPWARKKPWEPAANETPTKLEVNLPLPATGEEAMKRLLACRGKDPYRYTNEIFLLSYKSYVKFWLCVNDVSAENITFTNKYTNIL
jgi:hypothetical protein